jgi:hypothetical protein
MKLQILIFRTSKGIWRTITATKDRVGKCILFSTGVCFVKPFLLLFSVLSIWIVICLYNSFISILFFSLSDSSKI